MGMLEKLHSRFWTGVDAGITRGTRSLAKRVSRRGFVGRLGTLLVGAGALVTDSETNARLVDSRCSRAGASRAARARAVRMTRPASPPAALACRAPGA